MKIYVHYEGSKGPAYSNSYNITSFTTFGNIINSFISDYNKDNKILLNDRNIDFRNKKLNVSFHCQVLNTTEPSMRREEAINEIFSKTFDTN